LNYERCDDTADGFHRKDGSKFEPYDACYNGTVTLDYGPTNASDDCTVFITKRNSDLAIGQIQHPVNLTLTRAKWDDNPFFIGLKTMERAWTFGCDSDTEECAPGIGIVSSQTDLYWTQVSLLNLTAYQNPILMSHP
jgi:hypothetical protein